MDRYQIIKEIGRGGMGVVFKAYDPQLQREIALKVLLAGEESRLEEMRFLREARTTAQLCHPNIVAVHDIGNAQGPFFTMDFINGESLKTLATRVQLPTRRIVSILIKVTDAVAYAHSMGIIHRDLKPSNIMIDKNGEPKVMDFGLAKIAHVSKKLSKTGMVIGTLQYMAPEQARGMVNAIDQCSDIYALGIILYELLTGSPPFRGETSINLIYRIIVEEPVPPSKIKRTIPRELERICLKAIEKQKEHRYQLAEEFSADLTRFLRGEPVQARPIGSVRRIFRQIRRRRIPLSIAISIVVVAMVVLTMREIQYHKRELTIERNKTKFILRQCSNQVNAGISQIDSNLKLNKITLKQIEADLEIRNYHGAAKSQRQLWKLAQKIDANLDSISQTIKMLPLGSQKKILLQLEQKKRESTIAKRKLQYLAAYHILPNLSKKIATYKFPAEYQLDTSASPSLQLAILQRNDKPYMRLIWDLQKQQPMCSITHDYSITKVALAKNHCLLVSGGPSARGTGIIKLWNVSGSIIVRQQIFSTKLAEICNITLSPDNRFLFVSTTGGIKGYIVYIWSIKHPLIPPAKRHFKNLRNVRVCFSHDGEKLAFTGSGSVYSWQTKLWPQDKALEHMHIFALHSEVQSLAFANDYKLAIGSANRLIIYDKSLKMPIFSNRVSSKSLRWHPDGDCIAALNNRKLIMWNSASEKKLLTLPLTNSGAYDLLFLAHDRLGIWQRTAVNVYQLAPSPVKKYECKHLQLKNDSQIDIGQYLKAEIANAKKVTKNLLDALLADLSGKLAITYQDLYQMELSLREGESLGKIFELLNDYFQKKLTDKTTKLRVRQLFVQVLPSVHRMAALPLPHLANNLLWLEQRTIVAVAPSLKHLAIFIRLLPPATLLWNIGENTITRLNSPTIISSMRAMCFSPNGSRLAGQGTQYLRVWDVRTGEILAIVASKAYDIYFVNENILIATDNRQIVFWQLKNKRLIGKNIIEYPHFAISFTADRKMAALIANSGVNICKVAVDTCELKTIRSIPLKCIATTRYRHYAVCLSDDGQVLALGLNNDYLLFDLKRPRFRQLLYKFELETPITRILFDKRTGLYWVVTNRSIFICNPHYQKPLEVFPGYLKISATFAPDFRYVAYLSPKLQLGVFALRNYFSKTFE